MTAESSINWISAFNHLFILMDRNGEPTYCSGPSFLRMAQQVDPGVPSYEQLIPLRQRHGKSTSRKAFYWDILQGLSDQQKLQLFRIFLDDFAPHAPNEVDTIRAIVFGGGHAVPTTIVPLDLWNSEKLNASLKDIDHAIDARQFNRATTLSYTCLEGLYKAYVRRHVPARSDLTDLIQLCRQCHPDPDQCRGELSEWL
jgi:hypothetical protein